MRPRAARPPGVPGALRVRQSGAGHLPGRVVAGWSNVLPRSVLSDSAWNLSSCEKGVPVSASDHYKVILFSISGFPDRSCLLSVVPDETADKSGVERGADLVPSLENIMLRQFTDLCVVFPWDVAVRTMQGKRWSFWVTGNE